MALKASLSKHQLLFKKPATTSRGSYKHRTIWLLKVWNPLFPDTFGLGECAPLTGLSIDDIPEYEDKLKDLVQAINKGKNIENFDFKLFPSIKFGIETALLDLRNGGKQHIFMNFYTIGKQGIPINGLVWMSSLKEMKEEAIEKIESGFECIKIKIGAHDFEKECELLASIRKHKKGKNTILRLDANGAFTPKNALEKLNILSQYNIHSIEQPIKPKQTKELKKLCIESPIPIALDEELIGINDPEEMKDLLTFVQPQYIVLKPNLVGGFIQSDEWIKAAESLKIGWWLTSALESNVGLNAIAQYAASKHNTQHSGLGTGKLFEDNFTPYTKIINGFLWRDMGQAISDNPLLMQEPHI
jgi:o-succinylbenzoate synthase